MPDRCPVCDRVKATWWDGREDLCHRDIPAGRKGVCTMGVCLRDIEWCESHAVDWRSRALAAEGRLRTAEQTIPVLIAKIEYWGSQEDGVPEEVWRPYMTMKNWAAAHTEETP